jgi:pilus assembly protein FimV
MAVLALVAITVVGCGGEGGPQPETGVAGRAAAPDAGAAASGGTTGSAGMPAPSGAAGTASAAGTSGAAGATGEGGAAGAPTLDRFVGTWKYTSGTITRLCAGAADTIQLTGDNEFARSIDGGLTLKGDCAAKLMISGTTATGAPGFSCNQVNDDGTSSTLTYSSLVYSTLDGVNMTVSAAGSVTYLTGTNAVACTFSAMGSLMKYAL